MFIINFIIISLAKCTANESNHTEDTEISPVIGGDVGALPSISPSRLNQRAESICWPAKVVLGVILRCFQCDLVDCTVCSLV
jgi:hypothetical protein